MVMKILGLRIVNISPICVKIKMYLFSLTSYVSDHGFAYVIYTGNWF